MRDAGHAIDEYVDLLLSPPDASAARSVAAVGPDPELPHTATDPSRGPDPAARQPGPATVAEAPPRPQARQPEQPHTAEAHRARWLRLRCDQRTCALELLKIREVVLPAPLLPLRGAASAVIGVMNLRGQVVPVLDLGLHFSGAAVESSPATRIIVLEDRNEVLGLRVSAVQDIVLLDESRIEDARSSQLAPVGDRRIRGIARFDGAIVLLLDAARLLATALH